METVAAHLTAVLGHPGVRILSSVRVPTEWLLRHKGSKILRGVTWSVGADDRDHGAVARFQERGGRTAAGPLSGVRWQRARGVGEEGGSGRSDAAAAR